MANVKRTKKTTEEIKIRHGEAAVTIIMEDGQVVSTQLATHIKVDATGIAQWLWVPVNLPTTGLEDIYEVIKKAMEEIEK